MLIPELHISFTSDALVINGRTWDRAPSTAEVCQAVGPENLIDGDFVTIHGKPVSRFKYFEALGISILETVPEGKVKRISIHMEVTSRKRNPLSPYGGIGERPTNAMFCGQLDVNGKQLKPPLRFSQFPIDGELRFIDRIALGNRLSAFVAVASGFVQRVSLEFRKEYTETP